MATKKVNIKSEAEFKKMLNNLDADLRNLKNALVDLRYNILLIEQGDGKVPYWSGKRAYAQMNSLKGHYNSNYAVYAAVKEFVDGQKAYYNAARYHG